MCLRTSQIVHFSTARRETLSLIVFPQLAFLPISISINPLNGPPRYFYHQGRTSNLLMIHSIVHTRVFPLLKEKEKKSPLVNSAATYVDRCTYVLYIPF